MTQADRDRAAARFNTAAKAAADAKSGKTDRDAASKAVLDNMAKLRAMRLAKEAAEPPKPSAPIKKPVARAAKSSSKTAPALADWLASQQNGGRRT